MKGTVYKRCRKCGRSVQGRSCGKCDMTATSWAFRVRVGKDTDGDWIEERRSGFETKREAERALAQIVATVGSGSYVRSSELTVASYLRDEWLPATAPPMVGHETWQDRKRNLEHHLISRIGDIRLQDLNAGHLTRLYGELLTEGRMDGEGGLSPTSVRRIHAMIRKALNDAVRWGLLERNVATLADPPPARLAQAARRASMTTWTAAELRSFLGATSDHELHPLWYLAAMTGMRRSELIGLCWDDVDLTRSTVTVRRRVVPGADGYVLEDEQKSPTSGRTIHVDRRTVALLREQRREDLTMRSHLGADWNPRGLVFPQSNGTWWNPPAVSLAFRRAVKEAGLRAIRFHDLRHTHASNLLAIGINPKVVSERLGHSSVAFTLDTYAHVMPGMQPDAAEQFSDFVFDEHSDDEEDVA